MTAALNPPPPRLASVLRNLRKLMGDCHVPLTQRFIKTPLNQS